jgi:hypothetical protein
MYRREGPTRPPAPARRLAAVLATIVVWPDEEARPADSGSTRLTAASRARSVGWSLGRGIWWRSTPSWWRSTRISKSLAASPQASIASTWRADPPTFCCDRSASVSPCGLLTPLTRNHPASCPGEVLPDSRSIGQAGCRRACRGADPGRQRGGAACRDAAAADPAAVPVRLGGSHGPPASDLR